MRQSGTSKLQNTRVVRGFRDLDVHTARLTHDIGTGAGSVRVIDVRKAGPAKLHTPTGVDTAPEGEDIARENWSKH